MTYLFLIFLLLLGRFNPNHSRANRTSALATSEAFELNNVDDHHFKNERLLLVPSFVATMHPYSTYQTPTAAPNTKGFSFPTVEYDALVDFYYSTNGPTWTWGTPTQASSDDDDNSNINTNKNRTMTGVPWNITSPQQNPCVEQWEGIYCNCTLDPFTEIESCVTAGIVLRYHNLTGKLPSNFGESLPFLEEFDINHNHVRGQLPHTLGNCSLLHTLYLANNSFNSTLPSEIGEGCVKLQKIQLLNNRFHGTIPVSFTQLYDLIQLGLGENWFYGTIPSGFSALTKLEQFVLAGNFFTGKVPKEIVSNLINLKKFNVARNFLTGKLPIISNQTMPHLKQLSLQVNHFTGSIPWQYGTLSNLTVLEINNNKLTGTLPVTFSDLYALRLFGCSNNHLHGPLVDVFFTEKLAVSILLVDHNTFTGPMFPTNLSYCQHLVAYNVYQNHLTGTIPNVPFGSYERFTYLDFGGNRLTGTIPTWIANNLSTLTYLYVNNNHLHGTIPSNLGDYAKYLAVVYVQHNQLSGTIPNALGNALNLRELKAHDNLLTGTIPSTLANCAKLTILVLNQNQLVGSLPQFHPPSDLETIDVASNQITGTIPYATLFAIEPLQTVIFSDNCFEGTISNDICQAKLLINLVMDGYGAASNCQPKIFPNVPYFTSFADTSNSIGTVPSCLFTSMPTLVTIYLSGDKLIGTLPTLATTTTSTSTSSSFSSLTASKSLQELALSYNMLTGTIPLWIQERTWTLLDLSKNKLTGTLSSSIYPLPSYGYLALDVNRISGKIPDVIQSADNLTILTGNMYTCDWQKSGLPNHDPNTRHYSCGSDAINSSIYLWLVALVIALLVRLFMLYWFSCTIIPHTASMFTSNKALLQDENGDGKNGDFIGSIKEKEQEKESEAERDNRLISVSENHLQKHKSLPIIQQHHLHDQQQRQQIDEVMSSSTSWFVKVQFHVKRGTEYFQRVILEGYEEIRKIPSSTQQQQQQNSSTRNRDRSNDVNSIVAAVIGDVDMKVNHIRSVFLLFFTVRYIAGAMLLLTIFLLIPLYGGLSNSYSTYDYSFAWSISAILVSGSIPSAVYVIVFSGCICLSIHLFYQKLNPVIQQMQRNKNKKRDQEIQLVGNEASSVECSSDENDVNDDENQKSHLEKDCIVPSPSIYASRSPSTASVVSATSALSATSSASSASAKAKAVAASILDGSLKMIINVERRTFRWATILVGSMNFVIMVLINIVYVGSILQSSTRQLIGTQILLSIFKVQWNEFMLWKLYPYVKVVIAWLITPSNVWSASNVASFGEGGATPSLFRTIHDRIKQYQFTAKDINFMIFAVILNNIFIPCIAIAVVSPRCYYNAFFAEEPHSLVTIYSCQFYRLREQANHLFSDCLRYVSYGYYTTYNAPFYYRYECSAAFSIKFVAVYIFMFVISGAVVPLSTLTLQYWYHQYCADEDLDNGNVKNSNTSDGKKPFWKLCVSWLVRNLLPNRWKTLRPNPPADLQNYRLLSCDRLIVRFSSYLAILLAFGVLFPPLAIVAVISIYSITYFEQFAISRLLVEAKALGYTWYQEKILKECESIAESWFDALKIILPFVSFSCAFIVFDTLGDQYGWKVAVGPSMFVFVLPVGYYYWNKSGIRCCSKLSDVGNDDESDNDILVNTYVLCRSIGDWVISIFFGSRNPGKENDSSTVEMAACHIQTDNDLKVNNITTDVVENPMNSRE